MITTSISESTVTGLKIGRGEIVDLSATDLLQIALDDKYDILKLKINAGQANVFDYLDKLGLPYNINSILFRNSFFFGKEKTDTVDFQSPYHFEELSPANVAQLDAIFESCVTVETGIVYPSWLQEALIDKHVLQQAASAYARSFATREEGKMGWLIKQGDQYIGYNLGRKTDSIFEGILIGVLPEYRNKGAASYVYQYFINRVFPEMGISQFFNDVQIQNAPSLRSTFKEKIVPSASWININLFPLLSYGTDRVVSLIGPDRPAINDEESGTWQSIRKTRIKNKNVVEISSSKVMPAIKNKDNSVYRIIYYDSAGRIAAAEYTII
jgi:GNAT superfamily N-acetyltransferase